MHLKSKDQKASRDPVADIMSEQLGHDPCLTKKTIPNFAPGCWRMTPGSGYLQSLRAPNVEVVTESVTKLMEDGIVDESGKEHKVDVVVFATGFDTFFMPHFKVIGRDGANLREQFGDFPKGSWASQFRTFQICSASFRFSPYPGLCSCCLVLVGPSSPASHSSLLPTLEWYTQYMFQMINRLQTESIKAYEPRKPAVCELQNHPHELIKRLAWPSACCSSFRNKKSDEPMAAIYPGSPLHFFEMLKNVRSEDYEITYWTQDRFQFMGNGYTGCEIDPDRDPV